MLHLLSSLRFTSSRNLAYREYSCSVSFQKRWAKGDRYTLSDQHLTKQDHKTSETCRWNELPAGKEQKHRGIVGNLRCGHRHLYLQMNSHLVLLLILHLWYSPAVQLSLCTWDGEVWRVGQDNVSSALIQTFNNMCMEILDFPEKPSCGGLGCEIKIRNPIFALTCSAEPTCSAFYSVTGGATGLVYLFPHRSITILPKVLCHLWAKLSNMLAFIVYLHFALNPSPPWN